jgi:hypothetical protein
MFVKLTATVLSNDGETAYLRISNGDIVHCYRAESLSSREEFFNDFTPGEEIADDLSIERLEKETVH